MTENRLSSHHIEARRREFGDIQADGQLLFKLFFNVPPLGVSNEHRLSSLMASLNHLGAFHQRHDRMSFQAKGGLWKRIYSSGYPPSTDESTPDGPRVNTSQFNNAYELIMLTQVHHWYASKDESTIIFSKEGDGISSRILKKGSSSRTNSKPEPLSGWTGTPAEGLLFETPSSAGWTLTNISYWRNNSGTHYDGLVELKVLGKSMAEFIRLARQVDAQISYKP